MAKIGVNWWFVFDYLRSLPCEWFAIFKAFSLIIIRFQESFLCCWILWLANEISAGRLQRKKRFLLRSFQFGFRCLFAGFVVLSAFEFTAFTASELLALVIFGFRRVLVSKILFGEPDSGDPLNLSAQIIFITNFCNHFYNVLNRVSCANWWVDDQRELFRN